MILHQFHSNQFFFIMYCPTPTSSMTSPDELWAEPAIPPSPTPSTISITNLTPDSKYDSPYTNPVTDNNLFSNNWPPLSPILPHADQPNNHMDDTYILHTPVNHNIDDLPQNITIMNDTYVPYNFYKF